jgi:hypothetical protein
MNTQNQNQGLLGQVRMGDTEAIRTVQDLVDGKTLVPVQLQATLCAAAIGKEAQGAAGEAAGNLARKAAWKMWAQDSSENQCNIATIRETLISKLRNPDEASVEELKALTAGAAVLVEEGIIRNGALIEIADAISESLMKTNDYKRKTAVWATLPKQVFERLPHDEEQLYHSICVLYIRPMRAATISEKSILAYRDMDQEDQQIFEAMVTLKAALNRDGAGRIKLGEQLRGRIEAALPQKPKDGDTALPKPLMPANIPPRRNTARSLISGIGNRLASGPKRT